VKNILKNWLNEKKKNLENDKLTKELIDREEQEKIKAENDQTILQMQMQELEKFYSKEKEDFIKSVNEEKNKLLQEIEKLRSDKENIKIEYPNTWANMPANDILLLDVQQASQEFGRVADNFFLLHCKIKILQLLKYNVIKTNYCGNIFV